MYHRYCCGFLLLLLCYCGHPAWAQPKQPPKAAVEHLSLEQGLSDRNVTGIVKDERGGLWISTENGLNRFDGHHFVVYDNQPRNPHQIEEPKIVGLMLGKAGLLHLLREGGVFEMLNPSNGQRETVRIEGHSGFKGRFFSYWQTSDGRFFATGRSEKQIHLHGFDEEPRHFTHLFDLPIAVPPIVVPTNKGVFRIAFESAPGELSLWHVDASGKVIGAWRQAGLLGPGQSIKHMEETPDGTLWIALSGTGGVYGFKEAQGKFLPHPRLPPNTAFNLILDKAQNLICWQTLPNMGQQHFYVFTPDGRQLDYSWIFAHQTVVNHVYSDDYSRWLITGSNDGVYRYQLHPSLFTSFLNQRRSDRGYGTSTRGMAKFGTNTLVIATEQEGLYELNLSTNTLTRPGDRFPQLAALNALEYTHNLLAQGDSAIWITARNGIWKYLPGQRRLRAYHIVCDPWCAAFDEHGEFWMVCPPKSLLHLDPATGVFTEHPFGQMGNPLENVNASYLVAGRNGVFWVGTASHGLFELNVKTGSVKHYTAKPGDPAGLNSNQISCIYEDGAGMLWLGTLGGGLHVFDPKIGKTVALYTRENGLCHNSVSGLLPDGKGNYWVSTYNGLSFFNAEQKSFFNYYTTHGLSHNEFNRFSFFRDTAAGCYYFGGMNGVNVFEEKNMRRTDNKAQLLISELSFSGSDGTLVRQDNIMDGASFTLPPNHRLLQLRLALADYADPDHNQFAYRLEGMGDVWNNIGHQRELNFNQLPAGQYVLHLRGADRQGNWSEKELTLHFTVEAFWYRRWWAWLLYAALLASGGFYFYRFSLRQKIAEKEAQRLQELDSFKNRLFTNVTHEFRTPLTVILGMVERWTHDSGHWTAAETNQKIGLIKRNAENLLRLVNQILDLAKLESNALRMNYVQGDVLPYLRYIAESLHSVANAQNVLLRVESKEASIRLDYDPERLLQIVHNLLSNAIKFTPSGGKVFLRAEVLSSHSALSLNLPALQLTVTDNGVGIPSEDLPYIFDRFYQANNLEKARAGGTGIGLALTKELVQLMGGQIRVDSPVAGGEKGAAFTVTLPIRHEAPETTEQPSAKWMPAARDPLPVPTPDSALPTLLLIEDNPDVVEYLTVCLRGHYALDYAYNGRAGIEKALETIPDLIVSDVMMPEKDGFEVCDALKNDERTSHIPLVLLTAKADMESRIAGLRRGADAYLAKPFNQDELGVTLGNLLESRKKWQVHFAQTPLAAVAPIDAAQQAILAIEDAFVQKVKAAVEARLSDASFTVEHLCRALAMSQPQLHRKLTALTGQNATLFIRGMRLDRAKALLSKRDKTVSEVAFEVGFDDPKYFSRVFAEAFGVVPSKY